MSGSYIGEWANEGGAVGDCGGVVMTKKQSSSQVSCGEVVAVSTTFTNDANQMNMQLSFNTTILLNLEEIKEQNIILLLLLL